jgi:raffinose/stachyose/melibiose transport system permease protein
VTRGRGGDLLSSKNRPRLLTAILFITPALALYGWLVLGSFGQAVQYSLYDWNGFGEARFVGLQNYVDVFSSPARLGSLLHAFQLMVYFTGVTLVVAVTAAAITRAASRRRGAGLARAILFMPQVIPLAAAAIGWSWIYSRDGAVNQFLSTIGLEGITRSWLADPATALPAVGFIGTWALLGLVTLMITAGMAKIDTSLFEAARIDGANAVQEFFAVTLPGVRRELVVCATLTTIASLAAFDIVYMTTQGGPAKATMVPGIDIYILAFGEQNIGAAAAMGIVLMAVVLLLVIPLQRLAGRE